MQRISLLITVVVLLASSVAAQSGGIKGKVKNLNGDGIGGSTITARLNGRDIKSTTANKKGEFAIDGLEPGSYNLVVDATGYSSGVKYAVEVANGKVRDLGDKLILTNDRGSFVILDGGVFYKDGTRLPGAEVKIERISPDGSTHKITTMWSNNEGDFGFRQRPGAAQKWRVTANFHGKTASKDVELDGNAAVYHVSLLLDIERPKPEFLF